MPRWSVIVAVIGAVACSAAHAESESPAATFRWTRLPDLQAAAGLESPFVGVSNGALIVAGGANTANHPAEHNQAGVCCDAVHVLDRPGGRWRRADTRLPRGLSHGVSLSLSLPVADGVLCLGGGDGRQHYAEAYLLQWDGNAIRMVTLPALPSPVACACGATLGTMVYVAGGLEQPNATVAMTTFWALDLSQPIDRWQWQQLDPWPGPGRTLAIAGAQDGSFFLIGGAEPIVDAQGTRQKALTDGYRYTPGKGWRTIAAAPWPVVAAPSPAAPLGQSHLAIFGGRRQGRAGASPHYEPATDILAYHTITNTWRSLDRIPDRIDTPLVSWAGGFVMCGGGTGDGTYSPRVDLACPIVHRAAFGWLNYGALVLYLSGVVGLGCWFSRRNKSTDDFFRGGQRVPWWAAGISIFATMVSSISYMAIPAKTYATDWSYYGVAIAIVLVQPLVVWFYLPVFRQLDVTSAYEYLEKRFNLAVRWFGSLSFIVLQIGRMAIVLYLPALALATVSNLDIYVCIILMGALCVLYTMLGGMEAVIWTDVMQTVVLLGGALVALFVIVRSTAGGLPAVFDAAQSNGKLLENLDWSWDLTAATVWVILLGNFLSNLVPYTASQDVVQRYITTKDARQAARSIWTNAAMTLPSVAMFFAVGTALFAFYKSHPDRLDPNMQTDAVFPLFIIRELPAGIGGLVVAGIFAAAQSTLSGGLNSVATCWVTDFHRRLRPASSDLANLWMARCITLVLGIAVTAIACVMATLSITSLWDAFISILNLTGSALAGLFALGLFTRRANGSGALFGAIASLPVLYYVQQHTKIHFFLYAGVGILCCFVVGWCASWVIGRPLPDLNGLTFHTLRRKTNAPSE